MNPNESARATKNAPATLTIEQTVDAIAPYLHSHCIDMEASLTLHRIFPLHELAKRTDTSVAMLGKIRKRFRRALAQAMTPGRDLQFQVGEQSYYGRAAITVRRIIP